MRTSGASTRPSDPLIVALDFDRKSEALEFIQLLGDEVSFYKVGYTLFMAEGPAIVRQLLGMGKRVFLDLKFVDIDQTMRRAIANMPAGVELTTVYGNADSIAAACSGRHGPLPYILAVSTLSSQAVARASFADSGPNRQTSDDDDWERVSRYAETAVAAGADGLIASGEFVSRLSGHFTAHTSRPILVAPGIRPAGSAVHEHKRTLTPASAINSGADYIVIGRPLYQAPDARRMLACIRDEIAG